MNSSVLVTAIRSVRLRIPSTSHPYLFFIRSRTIIIIRCISEVPLEHGIWKIIAIFKVKAHIRRSGTSRNNQRQ